MKKRVVKKRVVREKKGDDRIPSGISSLDSMIEGGLERKSINLIVGSSGSGKTIFAVQFVMQGINNGEKVLYVTFEEKKEEFYDNMLDFGWDLKKLEDEGKFVFLEYTPEKVKTMLEEGGGIIESIIIKEKITRIVIDSITSFELLFDEELEKREAALNLFNILRKWECTSLLTYERDPMVDKKSSSRVLEFESDSIIILYFVRNGKERARYLEVLKMRGTKHSTEIHKFEVTKQGIVVDKKSTSKDMKI